MTKSTQGSKELDTVFGEFSELEAVVPHYMNFLLTVILNSQLFDK
jgi:hypothetical protein